MLELRDYQTRAIDESIEWLRNNEGHPCLEIPTGGGKTVMLAEMCRMVLQEWNGRVLVLTHVKELIEQGVDTLREHWPGAPLGVYSAGLGKRETGQPITFAGIMSVRKRAAEIGHVDLVAIDECHLVNHEDQGSYRELIAALTEINPKLRVWGLTATPYRLGHGLITDEPAIFSEIIRPTSIEELIYKGFLSPMRSKVTGLSYDISSVKKVRGDFSEKDLAEAIDTDAQNFDVVREVIAIAGDRKAWLFFCAGVLHAAHIRDVLLAHGVTAECITGDTPPAKRRDILARYQAGEIQALTNANVLTTGFDYPGIDLIALLRPTMSLSLYRQMVGRGLRICEGKEDCFALDFAGVIEQHGPITALDAAPEKIDSSGNGEAPTKSCEKCHEIVPAAARVCPDCGTEFPKPEKPALYLRNDDVLKAETYTLEVSSWHWVRWVSKGSGKEMLRVDYVGECLDDPSLSEYLCVKHEGFARKKAEKELKQIALHSNVEVNADDEIEAMVKLLNNARPPIRLGYKKDEKNKRFWRIFDKEWSLEPVEPVDYDKLLDGDNVPF